MALTQRLVTRYARYNALKNALEKWLRDKRDEVVEALRKGQKCPDRGPYLLELSEAAAHIDWKAEWRAHLKANGWTSEWIDEKFAMIEAAPRPTQIRLLSKVNPAHRGKVTVRLPAA